MKKLFIAIAMVISIYATAHAATPNLPGYADAAAVKAALDKAHNPQGRSQRQALRQRRP